VPAPVRAAGSARAWPAARGLLDGAGPAASAPAAAHEQATVQRPAVHATAAGSAAVPAPPVAAAGGAPDEDPGSARLAQILAEGGVTPGGRRRRYRE
jgi:hypothetical protein